MPATKKQMDVIASAYRSIPELFRGFGDDKERLYEKCLASETQHRRGHPAPRGFSTANAAKYFAVKWLHEYLTESDKLPTLAQYLHMREECYFAAAMTVEHAEALAGWPDKVPAEFLALDYAALME